MGSDFPQEISEALRKEKAACTTTTLEASAFYLAIPTLFSSTVCIITQGFGGEKNKGGSQEAFRKDVRRVVSKRICATSLKISVEDLKMHWIFFFFFFF